MLSALLQDYLVPLLTPITTLVAGYFALRVYRSQKEDEKRNAANVIILEIASAEDALKKISVDKPYADPKVILMPFSSWDRYKHLLVSDFSGYKDEWDKITGFYSQCEEYDNAMAGQNDMEDAKTKAMIVEMQRVLSKYAATYIEDLIDTDEQERDSLPTQYKAKRDMFIDIYTGSINKNAAIDHYTPQRFTNSAKHALGVIDRSISTSTAGKRLKEIATHPKHTTLDRLLQRP